jgi:hypothetical protein
LLVETSGLIFWNDYLWTHNDNTDNNIYALDTLNGAICQTKTLSGAVNTEWEEISQDSVYLYLGDFGNNANGNRIDLHIIRVEKSSFLADNPVIDTIWFTYSDQTDLTGTGSNNTDFDCEAFIVTADSIYLFTKQWVSIKTKIYALPKTPGTYIAALKDSVNIQGLVTGAVILESKRIVALSGYSKTLQPFIYLLYDFNGNNFTSGNKRKIAVNLSLHQTEGIATKNGKKFFLTNEKYVYSPTVFIAQQMHIIDMTSLLGSYIDGHYADVKRYNFNTDISIFPNPSNKIINIENLPENFSGTLTINDLTGKLVLQKRISRNDNIIYTGNLVKGIYHINIAELFIAKKLIIQ